MRFRVFSFYGDILLSSCISVFLSSCLPVFPYSRIPVFQYCLLMNEQLSAGEDV